MQKITWHRLLPLDVKHRWMFIAILLSQILVKNGICETDKNDTCRQKNMLFVTTWNVSDEYHFPSEVVYNDVNGSKLCFNVKRNKEPADCCHREDFNCSFEINGPKENYSLILNKEILSKQDIVLMNSPLQEFKCMPSKIYSTSSGFLVNIHNCLDKGVRNIRLSQNSSCVKNPSYNEEACKGLAETDYRITGQNQKLHCVSCKPQQKKPDVSISLPPPDSNNGTGISLENAANIMNNLTSLLEHMGNSSTATITIGHIKGATTKLRSQNQTNIIFGFTTSGDVTILEGNKDLVTGFSRSVQIPPEASAMAVKGNSSFVAVLLFPGMRPDVPNSVFLNDKVVGIEMGTEISNLSQTIDISYRNVDKNGSIASCRSWDGKRKEMIWDTHGCQTKETNNSITCQCSHLTFFAILMSPPPGNISSSDFTSLTYITSIGCGLSMFFLIVAIFMYFLIRKGKASQATKILMNLFVAMITLNLSFLVNESIANLGNFSACVVVAAVMHYAVLATFTWFFIQALHLYFSLWKFLTDVKYYLIKICLTGWVTPAVVVVALLATRQYDYMVIYTDDGNSAKMCWISDAVVHKGVNVGYYAVVFVFTLVIFIMTVRQIVFLKPAAEISSIKTKSFSILGLFLLLGITWAFAFFSHGPLLIPSYYIFTILNSLQGFFLFIYYHNSSKTAAAGRTSTVSSSSTATSNTASAPPLQ